MKLDLTSFKSAVRSLKEAFDIYKHNKSSSIVRDSVIQRFEYTYGLSVKMVQRYLKSVLSESIDVDYLSFNDLIRTANERGLLLSSLEQWRTYREKRNMTSHTYDQNKAEDVVSIVDSFIKDVDFLLDRLDTEI
ncbi:MAG: nucleotidyltransferase substrate binding protein [Endomicrobium sp.]|jgi:nucleotidyltransferase substrate binding protein (TIGR01987 family)|nr:nucleotidyltransferase substrate binding protein [Endomicrobium sp.]